MSDLVTTLSGQCGRCGGADLYPLRAPYLWCLPCSIDADGRTAEEFAAACVCPTCGATGGVHQILMYGRVVCPCIWTDDDELDDDELDDDELDDDELVERGRPLGYWRPLTDELDDDERDDDEPVA